MTNEDFNSGFQAGMGLSAIIFIIIVGICQIYNIFDTTLMYQEKAVDAGHAEFYRDEVTGPLKWRWKDCDCNE